MGVRDGDFLRLLDAERTGDRLTLTCSKAGEVVVIQGGLHGSYNGGLTFTYYSTSVRGHEQERGTMIFGTRDEDGRHGAYSVYCDDLERLRKKLQGVEVENELLPDLDAFDLNPDGSVTLTLSSPRYGTALLSFNGKYRYRLTEIRVKLPLFGMTEALIFCLGDRNGLAFNLKVCTTGAMDKHTQIREHITGSTPKYEAATIGMSWSVAAA